MAKLQTVCSSLGSGNQKALIGVRNEEHARHYKIMNVFKQHATKSVTPAVLAKNIKS